MSKSRSFSSGVDRVLQDVRPYGNTQTTSFPRSLTDESPRRRNNQTLGSWFVNLVDSSFAGDPTQAAIEPDLAVFVRLRWRKKQLIYANMQAVFVSSDLETYYLVEKAKLDNTNSQTDPVDALYLRLDFDDSSLGELFSHPSPHIHLEGESSPRFPLGGHNRGNIVMDFLEFLYLNYKHQQWLEWVEREWTTAFLEYAKNETLNPLPTIIQAFRDNHIVILRDNENEVKRVRQFLRTRKDELFTYAINVSDRELLEYP